MQKKIKNNLLHNYNKDSLILGYPIGDASDPNTGMIYANLNQEELALKDQYPLYLFFDHLYNHQVVPEREIDGKDIFGSKYRIYFKELYYMQSGSKEILFLYIQASLLTISNSSCISQGTLPCMTSIIDCGMCAF